MKTFIYSTKESKRYYTVVVWRLKQNKPELVGYSEPIHFNSQKGERGEVMDVLKSHKAITKKEYGNGYMPENFAIFSV